MKHDHELLHSVGSALYGENWQSAVARDLGVAIRTVQRWAVGEFAIPSGVWTDLAKLCRKRGAELAKWADRLTP